MNRRFFTKTFIRDLLAFTLNYFALNRRDMNEELALLVNIILSEPTDFIKHWPAYNTQTVLSCLAGNYLSLHCQEIISVHTSQGTDIELTALIFWKTRY